MKEEVKRISKLVAEGKLSAEDAADLIDAFYASERVEAEPEQEKNEEASTPPPPPGDANRDPFKGLIENIEKLTKEGLESVNWQEVSRQAKQSAKKGFESIRAGVEDLSKGKVHLGWLTMSEVKEVSLPLSIPADKTLRIENPSGDIRIVGGFDIGSITANATCKGATHEEAKKKASEYMLILEETDRYILVKQPQVTGLSVDLEVQFPGGGAVEVRSESGDIQILDTRGSARIHSRSGDVSLKGLNGVVELSLTSGDVSIEETVTASLTIENQSGDISIVRVDGNINCRTASGDVSVQKSHGKVFSIESVSGDVSVSLDEAGSGNLSVRTMSGDASVKIPDGGDYRVSVSALQGDVTCTLELQNEAKTKQRITGQLGAGTGSLDVSAVTGNVHVELLEATVS